MSQLQDVPEPTRDEAPDSPLPTESTRRVDVAVESPSFAGEQTAIPVRRQLVDAVSQIVTGRRRSVHASYRCQFHNGFGYREAAALVPYLAKLGISHLYASPLLQAKPGSSHGYDVCDHQALDADLGGEQGWAELQTALREYDMGLLLDIVPNHMSTHSSNAWWTDVLENGRSSPYAKFFDIDWHPTSPQFDEKVVLPVLGRQYGDALEAGELTIRYADGSFVVHYGDQDYPLGPKTMVQVLGEQLEDLRQALVDNAETLAEYENILISLEHLPARTIATPEAIVERQRDKLVIKRRLRELAAASPQVQEFIERNVREINGVAGDASSFDRLDALLSAQAYRLCHWKTAGDEVNYRRFFDINELAALCMEDPECFYQAHRLLLRWLGDGAVTGLRIDHIDGLYAPEQYLWRLQWAYLVELLRRQLADMNGSAAGVDEADAVPMALADLCHHLGLPLPSHEDWIAILGSEPRVITLTIDSLAAEPAPDAGAAANGASSAAGSATPPAVDSSPSRRVIPLFVVVEKILGPDEILPDSWPVAGTTGYDFLQLADGLYLPADGWRQLKQDYARVVGQTNSIGEVARDGKLLILRDAMAGELQMLAHQLNRISEQHRRSRDFTLNRLRFALREILVCFPVYRIYPSPAGVSERDQHFVAVAVAAAKRRNPSTDPSVFDFIRDVLLLRHPEGLNAAAIRTREIFAGRFQQVTSPVMAKGVEDTAFYVYNPLLSVNEVGNGPESPVVTPAEFHAKNADRAARYPQAMLAASTHDTKRSEDVRARLHLLAEVPRSWQVAVQRWLRWNRRHRSEVDGLPAPSRNDEYQLYQTLVGIWPLAADATTDTANIAERLRTYMQKGIHEAKQRTSWINPNEAYDRAVANFVTAILEPRRDNRFLADLCRWQKPIAMLGLVNSLAEVVLRLTSPGFADLYQGQEVWSFRMVDPDNRSAVDFAQAEQWLTQLATATATADGSLAIARELASTLTDPRTKLYVSWRLLELRKAEPALFAHGSYLPLEVVGPTANHAVAYARTTAVEAQGSASLIIVPRLQGTLQRLNPGEETSNALVYNADAWGGTSVELPANLAGRYRNIFTAREYDLGEAAPLSEMFADFPVAVLVSSKASSQ